MAGERGELAEQGASSGRALGRAAIGRAARRAVSWIATPVTGGTSKGVEVGVRILLLSLPLLAALAVVILLAVVGVVASFTSANASSNGSCAVTVSSAPALPGGSVSGSAQQRFSELKPVYQAAASQFALGPDGWAYLAAINNVETDFGLDMSVSSAGAVGWMQFEPSTFVTYQVDVPGVNTGGAADPYNPYDAIYAAANMLHAEGAPGDWSRAIFAYNHADWYVQKVTGLAQGYAQGAPASGAAGSSAAGTCDVQATGTTPGPSARISASGMALAPASAPAAVQAAIAAGNRIIHAYYSQERSPHMLNTVMSSYDCSGSTDFVLYNAGLNAPGVTEGNGVAGTSGDLETYGSAGAGQWITIYANSGHVFIEVAGIVMNTAWYAPVHPTSPSSGPRWQPASIIPAQIAGDSYGGFVERHPTGL